jgi:dsDNA-specific endonuclease/ATPase MutS2
VSTLSARANPLSLKLAQHERREGQAMEKLEKTLPLVMGLVFGISLIATAWDISFVSALP